MWVQMSDQRDGGIAWTDETWNPIRGCSKVSQGCKNCYAETMAVRFSGPGLPYADVVTDGRWNGKVVMVPERLGDPLRWKRPRRIFVNSMSDLFHESLTDEQIAAVFGVMAAAPQHTFQVLTKRPERAATLLSRMSTGRCTQFGVHAGNRLPDIPWMHEQAFFGRNRHLGYASAATKFRWPLPNVWLGVSVEDQKTADERIRLLIQCSAAVRWVSAEPLLGAVEICNGRHQRWSTPTRTDGAGNAVEWTDPGESFVPLDWVVVGGESGTGARLMHPDWARSLRDQCKAAGVPFVFKQWGDWAPAQRLRDITPDPWKDTVDVRPGRKVTLDGAEMIRLGKLQAGRLLDGVLHDEYPPA